MTRLSCHRFRANEVRLWLSLIAYNRGNLWRRLVLPTRIGNWSLTSLQQRLVKTGGRLIKHARYYWLLLAESHLTGGCSAACCGKSPRCRRRRDSPRSGGFQIDCARRVGWQRCLGNRPQMVRITVLYHPKSWSGPLRRQTLACADEKRSNSCAAAPFCTTVAPGQKAIMEIPA
jgi:hypothetical protein